MKLFLRICCVISFLCVHFSGQSQIKYSQVKIAVPKEKVSFLQLNDIDFDHGHYDDENQALHTVIAFDDIQKVKRLGFAVTVLVEDEEADFRARNKPKEFFKDDVKRDRSNSRFSFDSPSGPNADNYNTPAAFTGDGAMGGYYTLTQVNAKIDQMKSAYPNLVNINSIGTSVEGRTIRVVRISDNANVDEEEPEVLYTGLHHAREPMGMMNLIFFMQYLLENYTSNPSIKSLVDSRELYFIPVFNVDGYNYNNTNSPSGGGLHRKNRKRQGTTNYTNYGTDLNRNYDFGWDFNNGGSSTLRDNDSYRGPSAFSEPETVAMRNWLNTRKIKIAINYHAFGQYWIHGYCVPTGTLTSTDQAVIRTTGSMMTKYNTYKVGTPLQTVGYNARGSSDDWMMGGDLDKREKIYAFSPEVGPNTGNTTASFYPVSSQIIPLSKEVMFSNIQTAYLAGSYAKVDDLSKAGVSVKNGSFSFVARRIGLVDAPVTISIVPIQNISTVGSAQTINSLPNYLDTFEGSISYTLPDNIKQGDKIQFKWRMESAGIFIENLITKIYDPAVLFSDSFDGDNLSQWTLTGSWGQSQQAALSGTKSLSESPTGTYDPSSTTRAALAKGLNLSTVTNVYLSFWVKYSTENGRDKLRIQACNNLSSPTWVTLGGSHTIAENKGTVGSQPALTGQQDFWVRETIDLTAFVGNPDVGLRFEFTSDAANQDDGFYIDDVEVIAARQYIVLPITFISFNGATENGYPALNFKSEIDDDHSHFELEHSLNGIDFNSIKRFSNVSQFTYADKNASAGYNYYRVKAVSKSSLNEYTQVVSVYVGKFKKVSVFPNPAINVVTLRYDGIEAQNANIEIMDMSGSVMYNKPTQFVQRSNTLNIDVSGLRTGVYTIRIVGANSIVLYAEKLIINKK